MQQRVLKQQGYSCPGIPIEATYVHKTVFFCSQKKPIASPLKVMSIK